jgi:hypothetical protein
MIMSCAAVNQIEMMLDVVLQADARKAGEHIKSPKQVTIIIHLRLLNANFVTLRNISVQLCMCYVCGW